ncbi:MULTISPECIES: hypothetical protein [unclassified Cupriavidus]|uniref:hypothetical protein n=1 Tax=unclassified Cupriavidus TaxID=2640874 RepID=UPI00088A95C9|nr:hypothetical protein [Cupriavidus sp. YR651]SDC90552.1 hypothetical protein SAMN05216345_104394 [Cupriavidus sp. YR651]
MPDPLHPMHHDEPPPADHDVHRVVSGGPTGTFAVAGVATAIVVLIYLAFYFGVYAQRGLIQ